MLNPIPNPHPNYMPFRYVNYKCIITPLVLKSLGPLNLTLVKVLFKESRALQL